MNVTLNKITVKNLKTNYVLLINYCEESLIVENQPSIRLLIEWVLIRIFMSKGNRYETKHFWEKQQNVIFLKFVIFSLKLLKKIFINFSFPTKKSAMYVLG